ncbi:hypothetical protein [Rubripirellula amarantea]|nr:hypothetical protein [Rubripirellula amarantea]
MPDPSLLFGIFATVWLVYVADRLLDATRLNLERPTTYRHRFHYRYRKPLTAAWIAVLFADAAVIALTIDDSVRRPGFFVAIAVLAYAASVHIAGFRMKFFPKEVQVGVLFALGTSLVAWPDGDSIKWLPFGLSVFMSATLFTVNCLVVACHEYESDRAQSFASWSTEHGSAGLWAKGLATMLCIVSIVVLSIGLVPSLIALSTLGTSAVMLGLLMRPQIPTAHWPAGFLADFGLVLPPLFCCWVLA